MRAGKAAGKYLSTHLTLCGITLGAAVGAAAIDPRALLAPVALLIGGGLGYRLRDAVGDYRGQKALENMRKQGSTAQQQAVALLLKQAQAGVIQPGDRPSWVHPTTSMQEETRDHQNQD